jgi:ABC-type amino acid transport substrate-binding protein
MPQPQSPLQRRPEIPMTFAFLQSSIRFASGLLAGLPLATLIGPADAETTHLDAIVKGGILRVGLTEDYRPFSFAEASGKVEGIDVDMAMSLAQSRGVRLENPIWRRTASTSRWVGSPLPSITRK